MRILINDFCGHAFQIELSRELARRGHSVLHVFFADNLSTPKGETGTGKDDPVDFAMEGLHVPMELSKHSLLGHRTADIAYGKAVAAKVASFHPDVVISANMPLDAQRILIQATKEHGAKLVLSLQDVYSSAVSSELKRKPGILAGIGGAYYERMEKKLLRAADAVVYVAPGLSELLGRWGVEHSRCFVIENWAQLDEAVPTGKDNAEAREHELAEKVSLMRSSDMERIANRYLDVIATLAITTKKESSKRGTEIIRFEQILGIRFFVGTAQQAIDLVAERGGLVVVPSGPGMSTLAQDPIYREALLGADLVIADSGFMVILWNLLNRSWVSKLSGLKYLKELLQQEGFRGAGATFWVMPSKEIADRTLEWLNQNGIPVEPSNMYLAPFYNGRMEDTALVEAIERLRPRHVIMGVGGGVQEPLGFYLKQNLSYLPAIHCTGAAIGFLTGDQVHIPSWVDHMALGWVWRTLSDPKRFFPRYWEARHLAHLMLRYGDRLPVK
jgi:UDP-N-acetyl-D-mannosaminuronic acid transferase (WecB/TagA/CpsF family)